MFSFNADTDTLVITGSHFNKSESSKLNAFISSKNKEIKHIETPEESSLIIEGDLIFSECSSLTSLPESVFGVWGVREGSIKTIDLGNLRRSGFSQELIERFRSGNVLPGVTFEFQEETSCVGGEQKNIPESISEALSGF